MQDLNIHNAVHQIAEVDNRLNQHEPGNSKLLDDLLKMPAQPPENLDTSELGQSGYDLFYHGLL